VNPSAVDPDPQSLGQQPKKRPTEPVIDDITSFAWMLGASEIWDYGFISNGGIIKREGAGKKSITGNAMSSR
jgi:hypothetical protein